MPPQRATALRCVAAVGSAYLVQGIVAAVGLLLLGTLAQAGTPIEQQAGLLASGAVPWVLKFVLALLLDVVPSLSLRVRAVVISGLQACAAACLWGLAAAWAEREAGGDGSLSSLAAAWIALNFVAALQDVMTDNLALDSLRGRQSWTAMAMGTGHTIGFMGGSLLLGKLLATQGMVASLRAPASWVAVLAIACALALWMPGRPERTPTATSEPGAGERKAVPLELLWIPVVFVALMFGASMTSAITYEFVFGFLQWDYADYTKILLPVGMALSIAGALAMGPLVAKLGPARASMIAAAGLGLVWLGFAGASSLWHQTAMMATFAGFEGCLQSAMLVGLQALALIAVARSPLPTTAFVLAMAALNLPRVLAPLLAPQWVSFGWAGVFAACGVVQLIAVCGLWPLRRWGQT